MVQPCPGVGVGAAGPLRAELTKPLGEPGDEELPQEPPHATSKRRWDAGALLCPAALQPLQEPHNSSSSSYNSN